MKKSWYPFVLVLAVIVGGAIVIRQYRKEPAPVSRPDEQSVEVAPSEWPTKETPKTLVSGITLSVTTPANGETVSGSSLTVRGKTVAGAEVFVNDVETKADGSGNFSVKVTLDEGENYILVVANDASGNYAEKELTVTYTP